MRSDDLSCCAAAGAAPLLDWLTIIVLSPLAFSPHCFLRASCQQAWIAFETCRRLLARGHRAPLKAFLSGARAPALSGPAGDPDRLAPELARLPYEDFWAAFERRYGRSASLASEGVRKMLFPKLQARPPAPTRGRLTFCATPSERACNIALSALRRRLRALSVLSQHCPCCVHGVAGGFSSR